MTTPQAADSERFGERYTHSGATGQLAAEVEALGSDYQANGYTTMGQADELGRLLGLERGHLLLDIGAGCGWPGLYLAKTHGCSVLSVDPVVEGMGIARERARNDGIDRRSWAVRARADVLPLASASVDAVVHTDLLC